MFFKKPESKHAHPCIFVAIGMIAALGAAACTKPGRKFVKSKLQCIKNKLDSCDIASC